MTRYEAIADGKTLNTEGAAAGASGGTVIIPEAHVPLAAIFLKPGVHLEVERHAVLKGSTDIRDYGP